MKILAIKVLSAVISGIIFQAIINPSLVFTTSILLFSAFLAIWRKEFLFVIIAFLSAINSSLKRPMPAVPAGRDIVYSGVVVCEDHREDNVRLSISLQKAFLKDDTVACCLPVEFFTPDKESYLGKSLRIKGRITASKSLHRPNILSGKILKISSEPGIFGWVFQPISNHIDALFKKLFNEREYQISSALLLGGSSRIGKDLQDIFVRSGVLHILSVSGLHVGFVLSFISLILILLPVSPKIKLLIIMLVLFLYAGITGFRPSVLRASLMALLFGTALVFQRNVDGTHILNITASILLLINPLLLFDISAQLSFASVYGIIYLYPLLERSLLIRIKPRFLRSVASLMAISFSAQLAVSPLLIQYFQRIQTLAVIANLIVVPLSSLIIYLLFLCIIVSAFFLALAKPIGFIAAILIRLLVTISRFFASISFASIPVGISTLFLVLGYCLFIKRIRRFAIYGIPVMAILFAVANLSHCSMIKITKAGTVITLPEGKNILITTKTNSRSLLSFSNLEKIDYLLADTNFLPAKKSFYKTPDGLYYKRIRLGSLEISLDKKTNLSYQGQKIALANYMPEKDHLTYIIANNKNIYSFKSPLYGSIIDQIITEPKILLAKLRLLFCKR